MIVDGAIGTTAKEVINVQKSISLTDVDITCDRHCGMWRNRYS